MDELAEALADQQREKTLRHFGGLRRIGPEMAKGADKNLRKRRSDNDQRDGKAEEQHPKTPGSRRQGVFGSAGDPRCASEAMAEERILHFSAPTF
jgi:hypothetical protein